MHDPQGPRVRLPAGTLAPGSRRAVLPFAGKNVVIYHLGGSDYVAAAEECGECEGGAVTPV